VASLEILSPVEECRPTIQQLDLAFLNPSCIACHSGEAGLSFFNCTCTYTCTYTAIRFDNGCQLLHIFELKSSHLHGYGGVDASTVLCGVLTVNADVERPELLAPMVNTVSGKAGVAGTHSKYRKQKGQSC
jgi:hypothetical protein